MTISDSTLDAIIGAVWKAMRAGEFDYALACKLIRTILERAERAA